MALLRSKLFDIEQEKQRSEIQAQRKSQVACSLIQPKLHDCGLIANCPVTVVAQLVTVLLLPNWLLYCCCHVPHYATAEAVSIT